MKAFKCLKCGKIGYSSADLEHQTNPDCIYCGADEMVEVDIQDEESKNETR